MDKVRVNLKDNSYDILIGNELLNDLSILIDENLENNFIITDRNLYKLYGDKINKLKTYDKIIIEPGEESKSLNLVEKILEEIIEKNGNRKSKIIAFGGGVVGDIAGFCASIYMRGIPFIQIPTTLLAQVDSSVGGKTGVNLKTYKNSIGSFYQPDMVIVDTSILKTLPHREVLSGIGEIIKYGIIYDYDFFRYIVKNIEYIKECQEHIISYVIRRSVEIKASIVGEDEKEKGLRKILNFGHTIGHSIEGITQFSKYTHGEAVIMGMYYETLIARHMNFIEENYANEILDFLSSIGLDLNISDYDYKDLINIMLKDKKNTNNKISFILPTNKSMVKEILLHRSEIEKILIDAIRRG